MPPSTLQSRPPVRGHRKDTATNCARAFIQSVIISLNPPAPTTENSHPPLLSQDVIGSGEHHPPPDTPGFATTPQECADILSEETGLDWKVFRMNTVAEL